MNEGELIHTLYKTVLWIRDILLRSADPYHRLTDPDPALLLVYYLLHWLQPVTEEPCNKGRKFCQSLAPVADKLTFKDRQKWWNL